MDLAAGVSKSIRGGGKTVLYDSGKSVFLGNLPFDITVSWRGLSGCLHLCMHVSRHGVPQRPIWYTKVDVQSFTAYALFHITASLMHCHTAPMEHSSRPGSSEETTPIPGIADAQPQYVACTSRP